MQFLKVHGGYKLKGDIIPQGAKNEALQFFVLFAHKGKVVIGNSKHCLI